jgi:histidyl-tRNA synthetase
MKPSLPKGTRDFAPLEAARRRYIFNVIRDVFELFGYQALETPAMEKLETLTGKYGEEGDRLIFKILNSGEYLHELSTPISALEDIVQNHKGEYPIDLIIDEKKLTPRISEKALRYDLTVPFARFVAMNRDKLAFPFKRYQIQPVWRADRPQKGRYREFWQCDADIAGSASMLNEAEFIRIYDEVFSRIGLHVNILINNRKILSGIAEVIGAAERLTDITVAMDKLDKIGREKVEEEMITKGIPKAAVEKLSPIFDLRGNNSEQLTFLESYLIGSETGKQGILETKALLSYFGGEHALSLKQAALKLDLTLARGLNYYTGTILEVKARDISFGSIGGGGRYDDLTGIFGLPDVPGAGISFGADRIYDILEELELFPEEVSITTRLMLINFGKADERAALFLLQKLRSEGLSCELYPEPVKIRKQFEYAEKKGIPFVAIYGSAEREAAEPYAEVRNILSGSQEQVPLTKLAHFIKS